MGQSYILTKKELAAMSDKGNEGRRKMAVQQVLKKTAQLKSNIDARVEWLRWQALGNGAMIYDKSGIKLGVDFGVPEANKVTAATAWGADGATILANYERWVQDYIDGNDNGYAPDVFVIITSAVGIKCQDALMETQIKTYAASIEKKYGSLSDDAMMECINIIHQGGSGALTRILAKTQKPYTAKTIYAALCTDPADKSNNNQVGDYEDRQKVVYSFITKYCNKEGVNTMGYSRQAVADLVNSWVGKNEADGSYKTIIDIYNSYKGAFPRGTKMDYSWPWCACTWSAVAIKLGYTPIMPIEISCYYLIEAAKKKGIWIENDAHVPKVGEAVLYYWKDGTNFATTDCTGVPDHVGTVTEVYEKAGYFVVSEGNYSNAVKKRTMLINGRYIRGFISPKYTDDTVTPVTPAAGKDLTTVAREVILGVWGNMPERKTKLEASGYNFTDVQNKVNELLNKNVSTPSKPQNTGVTKVVAGSGASSFDKSLAGSYVTTTGLYMRHGAGKNKRAMVLIPEGTKVQNYGYYTSYNGTKWLYIQVTLNGVQYTGFSCKTYLKKQ